MLVSKLINDLKVECFFPNEIRVGEFEVAGG